MPDLSANFINPDYATPEQVKQMREMAAQLQSGAIAPDSAKHWTGALAQALMGLNANAGISRANQLQRQLLQQGQQGLQQAGQNPYAAQLLGMGQPANPTSPQTSNPQGAGAMPRGLRNNNPGNIEDGPFAKSIPGYQGSDGRFAIFDSPEHGQQAMDSLLSSYGKRGLNTPAAVINRWAPPGENNSTAYAATVAKQLGVDPNTPMNMADPAVRQQLGSAITGYENGGRQPMPQQMAQNGGDLSAFYMNPSIPQGLKDMVKEGLTPQVVTDVKGNSYLFNKSGNPPTPIQGLKQAGAPIDVSGGTFKGGLGTLEAMEGGGQPQPQSGQPGSPLQKLAPTMDWLRGQGAQTNAANAEAETGKMIAGFQGEGLQAKELAGNLDTLKQLGSRVGYGLGPEMQARMAKMGLYTPGVSEIQAYQNFIPYAGVLLRPEGSGRLMSQELVQFNQALGGLMVTPEGRATAIESLSRIAHYKEKVGEISSGSGSPTEKMNAIQKLPLPQLNWAEINKAAQLGGQKAPPPAAVQHLKANPALKEQFNLKYGNGAAERALSQ